jgi:hypothetical protein
MRLTAVRAFCIAAVASLVLLAAPSAHACNDPTLDAYPENPGPGDQVSFWLTNLTDGAEYSVNVDGIEVVPTTIARGSGPVHESFRMPDLGSSSRDVTVQAKVAHPDIADGTGSASPSDNVTYTILSGPASPTPVQEPIQERGASSPTDTQTSGGSGGSPHGPAGRGPDQPPSSPKPTGPQPSSPGVPATQPVELDVAGSEAGGSDAPVATSTSAQSPSVAKSAQPRRARTARRGGAVAGPPVPATLRRLPAADGTTRVDTVSGGLPLGTVIAVGVLLLAGLAGGGWAFVRARLLRLGPEPEAAVHAVAPLEPERLALDAELERLVTSEFTTVDVEAELQRMIAGELRAVDAGADTVSEAVSGDGRQR